MPSESTWSKRKSSEKKITEKLVKSLFVIKEINMEINNLVLFGDTICDTIVPSESTFLKK